MALTCPTCPFIRMLNRMMCPSICASSVDSYRTELGTNQAPTMAITRAIDARSIRLRLNGDLASASLVALLDLDPSVSCSRRVYACSSSVLLVGLCSFVYIIHLG